MANRITPGGNGSAGKGMIDIVPVCEGCSVFIPNPTHPPPDNELHIAFTDVLQKWMLTMPVRIRETLPIVHGGNTVALFIWWDRVEKPG